MTTRTPDDAAKQLRRLLIAIPALADDSPHAIADVAKMVGVDEATLTRDLRTLVTRVGYEPGGFMEPVRLALDSTNVQMEGPVLRRPMGLSPSELGALELGLAALSLELPPHEAAVAQRARQRIVDTATSLDEELRASGAHAVQETASEAVALSLSILRSALSARRKVALTYQSSNAPDGSARTVHPYGLVFTSGKWYLLAHCDVASDLRIFRLDRMSQVDELDAAANVPDDIDLNATLREGRAIVTHAADTLRVRYSAQVARWIAEHETVDEQPDGSVIVDHPLLDDGWAVRHVLQYGPEAIVLAPARIQTLVAERAAAMAN